MDGKLDQIYTIKSHTDQRLLNGVSHAWYEGEKTLHPWKGGTNPRYTGFRDNGKYAWVESPRFEGRPMQVGPLAQVLIGYAQGHKLTPGKPSPTGSPSKMARSSITKPLSPPLGTPVPAMSMARTVPMRTRYLAILSPIPKGRSKCSAPCIPLTLVWLVPFTPLTPRGKKSFRLPKRGE